MSGLNGVNKSHRFDSSASGELILALSKGRIFDDTLPLLEAAGIIVT